MFSATTTPHSNQLQHSLRLRRLALNTIWNVLGQAIPLVIAAFTIPVLIKRLGVDRFGVLTLAWALVGYFSLFDLGVGRALTKVVSDKLACHKDSELADAIWSGLAMMLVLGSLFAGLIGISAHWIVSAILRVPPALVAETTRSVYPLALCIPVITISTALRGVLEAHHRFGLTNAVRIGLGAFNFLGPLVTSALAASIYPVVLVLTIGRLISAFLYLYLCLQITPDLRSVREIRRDRCRELLRVGSWMTVSNIASPVMVYLDRFLISAILSVSIVAYYTTPFEVVTKLFIVPGAITSVLFPAFAALFVTNTTRFQDIYMRGLRGTLALMFPVVFLVVLFAPEAMRLWLGPEFQRISAPVLRWIAAGVLVNSVAQIPYVLLQAADRPDVTAKIHLVELPLYIAMVVLGIHSLGLTGAAIAWTVRLGLEALALFILAGRLILTQLSQRRFIIVALAGIGLLAGACVPLSISAKIGFAILLLGAFAALVWRSILQADEKLYLKAWLNRPALARD